MAIDDIRAAFLAASRPGLRLHQATLRYNDAGQQILGLTGWHADGTPFAFASAPFAGDPARRAAEIAVDLSSAHNGRAVAATNETTRNPMATPPINGLAATLREQLKAATARADALAVKAKSSVGNLHSVLDGAEAAVGQVDAAAADIQAALGLSTNGGPPLEEGK